LDGMLEKDMQKY